MNGLRIFLACTGFLFAQIAHASFHDGLSKIFDQYPYFDECTCMDALDREDKFDSSFRSALDLLAGDLLSAKGEKAQTVLFMASGPLKNEISVLASLMSRGISPYVYLVDSDYDQRTGLKNSDLENYEKAQLALKNFPSIMDCLASKYQMTYGFHYFYNLGAALTNLASSKEKLSAFFMIDFKFPAPKGLEFFTDSYSKALRQTPVITPQTHLFFLGKKFANGKIQSTDPCSINVFKTVENTYYLGCASEFREILVLNDIDSEERFY